MLRCGYFLYFLAVQLEILHWIPILAKKGT